MGLCKNCILIMQSETIKMKKWFQKGTGLVRVENLEFIRDKRKNRTRDDQKGTPLNIIGDVAKFNFTTSPKRCIINKIVDFKIGGF